MSDYHQQSLFRKSVKSAWSYFQVSSIKINYLEPDSLTFSQNPPESYTDGQSTSFKFYDFFLFKYVLIIGC